MQALSGSHKKAVAGEAAMGGAGGNTRATRQTQNAVDVHIFTLYIDALYDVSDMSLHKLNGIRMNVRACKHVQVLVCIASACM